MVVQVGKVTGREITTNRDGTEDVVMLQVEVSDTDDIQTVELHRGAGVDLNPPVDSIVVLVSAGGAWQIAATINDNVTPEAMDPGDYEIYASTSGAKGARVNLAGDDVTINEGADWAVQYTALKKAFDTLKSDFDSFVTTIFNVHVHAGIVPAPVPPGGSTLVPAALGVASTADMTPSKIATIKVP